MDDLTASQQETLSEFAVVTGISLDDADTKSKAIALLSYNNYNLNNSVLAYFDKGFALPEPEPEPTENISLQVESSSDFFATGLERFDERNYSNLQGDFAMVHVLPRLAKAPRISTKWQLDLGIHISRKAFKSTEEKDLLTEHPKPKKLTFLWIIFLLVPKTLSFLYSAFRYLFGLNLSIGYDGAPNSKFDFEAQQEFHFLLGILCDDSSVQFTQKLLETQRFKDVFSKTGQLKDTQLFVNNVDKSPEAFEVASTYNCRKLPFIFLIGNVSKDPSVMSSMSIIYKANCILGDDEEQAALIRKTVNSLCKISNDYNPQLVTKRFDKQEIEMSRIIKEKQDEAYLESLENDKVKKVEKENQRLQQEAQMKLKALREGFIKYLHDTKYFEGRVDGVPASNLIRISIKLPDGRRILQKFPKEGAMGEIYLFVETLLIDEQEVKEIEPMQMSVPEFLDQFKFSFELFKPLPKYCLPSSTETIQDFGNLGSGDNVLFEYVDCEDKDMDIV
ncbi:hypothetical protein METBIDRAFT_86460 [Metschnikowia bicuspidata var. bicuspidata NRRL YB-4993]|uniref:UBX domain-containing protein n=1 Tax=Metschnikowia bicuspidata var. bicuspidata NRRL YB-4993 TaxID=869754 RepID=A0A1A0HKS3_9ASCO|nr:hypothetical protein METBIDRAFT_86460 [Metschnikowia bicuspidata var. bicuspidata NRRL YB-4993]OBA24492.1 hypothetical protein METBIDRAFT_86460 [Metschnikowia bicuspidata var. bicuspidata NRRL YB-4993]